MTTACIKSVFDFDQHYDWQHRNWQQEQERQRRDKEQNKNPCLTIHAIIGVENLHQQGGDDYTFDLYSPILTQADADRLQFLLKNVMSLEKEMDQAGNAQWNHKYKETKKNETEYSNDRQNKQNEILRDTLVFIHEIPVPLVTLICQYADYSAEKHHNEQIQGELKASFKVHETKYKKLMREFDPFYEDERDTDINENAILYLQRVRIVTGAFHFPQKQKSYHIVPKLLHVYETNYKTAHEEELKEAEEAREDPRKRKSNFRFLEIQHKKELQKFLKHREETQEELERQGTTKRQKLN
jgi:hypothetical protein